MYSRTLTQPTSPWLGDVMAAAIHATGVDPADIDGRGGPSFDIPRARSVILIVVDGLGWIPLHDHAGHARTLRGFLTDAHVVDTCLPSTTAAALTALTTGRLPGQTRMVGYSVAQGPSTMNLLNFQPDVDAEAWQPCPTLFERLRSTGVRPAIVTTPKFAGSGFTLAALRGAEFHGAQSLDDRLNLARSLAEERPSLVYVYWSDIDHAGHGHGIDSYRWRDELEDFDNSLGRFLRRPPRDTSVVVTADHGMVDVSERIDIAQVPALSEGVRILAGEGRSVHVHALRGQGRAVADRWQEYLGDKAVIVTPQRYSAVIGEGPGRELIGDALVFMSGSSVIVDSRQHSVAMIAQKGVHGSFTEAEMLVPVINLG